MGKEWRGVPGLRSKTSFDGLGMEVAPSQLVMLGVCSLGYGVALTRGKHGFVMNPPGFPSWS